LAANIITLTPFRMYRKDDSDVIIPTDKDYEEVKGRCGYCRYALALPDKHRELSYRESCLESIMGYTLHFGKSAEDLASSIEEFPLLTLGKGLALNFDTLPFCAFAYRGNDKDPAHLYLANKFEEEEIKAFLEGLSKRKDELRDFSRIPYLKFLHK
jgi:hypothetical protein